MVLTIQCPTCEQLVAHLIYSATMKKHICKDCYKVFEYGFDEVIAEVNDD